jgi:hypothetical protein
MSIRITYLGPPRSLGERAKFRCFRIKPDPALVLTVPVGTQIGYTALKEPFYKAIIEAELMDADRQLLEHSASSIDVDQGSEVATLKRPLKLDFAKGNVEILSEVETVTRIRVHLHIIPALIGQEVYILERPDPSPSRPSEESPIAASSLPVSICDDTHCGNQSAPAEKSSEPKPIARWEVFFGAAARARVAGANMSQYYDRSYSTAALVNAKKYYWAKAEIEFSLHCSNCGHANSLRIEVRNGDAPMLAHPQCPNCKEFYCLAAAWKTEHILLQFNCPSGGKPPIRPSMLEIQQFSWRASSVT